MRIKSAPIKSEKSAERTIIEHERTASSPVTRFCDESRRVEDITVDRGSVANEFHECHERDRENRKNQRVKRSRPSSYRGARQPDIYAFPSISPNRHLRINRSFCPFFAIYSTQYSSTLIYHRYYRLLRNATKAERQEKNRGALKRTEVTGEHATVSRNRQRPRERPWFRKGKG